MSTSTKSNPFTRFRPNPVLGRELSVSTFAALQQANDNKTLNSIASKMRGSDIKSVFLESETYAKCDWDTACLKLSEEEVALLDPDYVIRTIRSSNFLAQPERRAKRNIQMFKERVKWFNKYSVNTILRLSHGLSQSDELHKSSISPLRIESFRNDVFPLKLFGFSDSGVPIVKFTLSECNWKKAMKQFKDKKELKTLIVLTLESLKSKLQMSCCRAESSQKNVFVTGKFILVCDVVGLKPRSVKEGYYVQMHKAVTFLFKFFPDLVLETYVINEKYSRNGHRILYPFVATRIVRNIKFFSNEKQVMEQLISDHQFDYPQLPVEYGGTFEGRYVVDITTDD